MRYFILILLLASCAKTAIQGRTPASVEWWKTSASAKIFTMVQSCLDKRPDLIEHISCSCVIDAAREGVVSSAIGAMCLSYATGLTKVYADSKRLIVAKNLFGEKKSSAGVYLYYKACLKMSGDMRESCFKILKDDLDRLGGL